MSLLGKIKPNGSNGFGYNSTAEDVTAGLSLEGKKILITGCNSGLGLESMRVLSMRGAHVIGTARTLDKAARACEANGHKASAIECELSDPRSVTRAVKNISKSHKRLDVILCNAGIMALPKPEKAHGYELQFFTNHIGHFILATGLLDLLADDGRVVMLSSSAHTMAPVAGIEFDNLDASKGYKPWTAYGQSKFANILFANELAQKFKGTGKTANSVHPGVIRTNLGRHMSPAANFVFGLANPLFLKSPQEGAATQCFAAVHPSLAGVSGEYLSDCNLAVPREDTKNRALAEELWTVSEKIAKELT